MLHMSIPSEYSAVENCHYVVNTEFLEKLIRVSFVTDFGAADPVDHGAVITFEPLQVFSLRSPGLASMEHGRADAGRVNLATHLR